MSIADLHTLTGAYAVHALPDDERIAFEHHLVDCLTCAQETAELTATAGRLGLAVSVVPPPGMRPQVLRRITVVRQEAPRESTLDRVSRTGAARRGVLSGWALAVCVAAVAALGGTAAWQHEQVTQARQQARQAEKRSSQIAAVLAAPDARTSTAKLAGGATGTVVVSASQDKAVLVVSGMNRPPHGEVYQMWFDDGGTMRAAGLLDAGRRDQAVLLSGNVDGASGMGITVEPTGGSDHPTSAPVALMSFPA
ncbi:anti-sigma factor domain-containing protein [Streptomyces sp. VRA16 Mangrove soil]|uniref:anti-sigma factor n=1 Tax=Streptomyces sp. VRA16 Mangrove soil TaxID=2817434 RepID=UPI001A9CF008|nr:anti-sigma factor [Streptomyces sp. VRA16 Mangrove soil]MBO1337949.1 anti-sigma factor [Streptomyces sp. VRA16 Mangrove soil]